MLKTARTKAEERRAEQEKNYKQAMKDVERAKQEEAQNAARLRKLRLAKEAADKQAADEAAAAKAAAKKKKPLRTPKGH